MHDACLGAVLPHQLVGFAEARRGGLVVPGLVGEHAQGVDRVVRAALARLALLQDRLRLGPVLAVGLREEIQRAAHAERGEGEIPHEHAAVGIVLGQAVEGLAIAVGGFLPVARQLLESPDLAIDLAAGARVEAALRGERGGPIQALHRLFLGLLAAVGSAQRLLQEELRIAAAAFLGHGAEVTAVQLEGAIGLAVAKEHAPDGPQGHATLGMVEARLELVVVHQLTDPVARTGPGRGVQATQEGPAPGDVVLGLGQSLEPLRAVLRLLLVLLTRRTRGGELLEGADVEVRLSASGGELIEVGHRADGALHVRAPALTGIEDEVVDKTIDLCLPRHGNSLR